MISLAFLRDPDWRRKVLDSAFGRGFWLFFCLAIAAGLLCFLIRGPDGFSSALYNDAALLAGLLPRVVIALSIAALVWFLLPRERIAGLVGSKSGIKGLAIATVAGTVTPGGPASAFSLLAAFAASGADRGALVTYITAWATMGLQRVLVWDVPFMGAEFTLLRVLVSLPLPLIAGLIARRLPVALTLKSGDAAGGAKS